MTDKDQMEILRRIVSGDLAGAREYANSVAGRKKHRARHPDAPFCTVCPHKAENRDPVESKTVVGKIDGKKRRRRMKPGELWCLNGDMFRINKNQRRWWGFDRRCPLNPHTHSCEVCGKRMCTYNKMCKSCAKSREYL